MPKIDSCHENVANALRKEGWRVSPTPQQLNDINIKSVFVIIDIFATRGANGGSTEARSIFIEVKCFPPSSTTRDLYTAIGQYIVSSIGLFLPAAMRPTSST